jgi:hypothetical protein
MTLHTFLGETELRNRVSFEQPDPETVEEDLLRARRRREHYAARLKGLALADAFEQVTLRELESLPWKLVAAGIRAVSQAAPR